MENNFSHLSMRMDSFLSSSIWPKTFVMSSITLFNVLCFLFALLVWSINRQTQIRPSRSQGRLQQKSNSSDIDDNATRNNRSFKNARTPMNSGNDLPMVFSGSDPDLFSHDWVRQKARGEDLVRTFSMDFTKIQEEMDESYDKDGMDNTINKKRSRSPNSTNPHELNMRKDMLNFVASMNVFSYLSDEAFKEMLKYMKYLDFPDKGSNIMCQSVNSDNSGTDENVDAASNTSENSELDGSVYIVISGSVDCTCRLVDEEMIELYGNIFPPSSSEQPKLRFTIGPGLLLTSQLAMLSDLVDWYQQRHEGMSNIKSLKSTNPIQVHARTSQQNTRLICVPSFSFLSILEKFPTEVHQIAQTVLGRTQRVTMQTLVKNLGLTTEIISQKHQSLKEDTVVQKTDLVGDWKMKLDACQKVCKNVYYGNLLDSSSLPSVVTNTTTPTRREREELTKTNHGKIKTLNTSNETKYHIAAIAAWQLGTNDIKSIESIQEHSSIIAVKPGSSIVEAGKRTENIYFVIDGEVEIGNFIMPISDEGLEKTLKRPLGFSSRRMSFDANDLTRTNAVSFQVSHNAYVGAVISQMAGFCGEVSMVTIRSSPTRKEPTYLLQISKSAYLSLINSNTSVFIQSIGNILKNHFSPIVLLLDWGLRWKDLRAASRLALKGEPCKSLWVVLNGRLRSLNTTEKDDLNKHEHGRGACIGHVQVLSGGAWHHDVFAIRNSELAELPLHVLEFIIRMFPTCGVHFARVIANQVKQQYMKNDKLSSINSEGGLPTYKLSVATIAIVPICFELNDDKASSFCQSVLTGLEKIAPCTIITKSSIKKKLGKINYTKNLNHVLKLARLLGDLEENNRLVVYQAESDFSWWTKICVEQSDCVLLIVDSEKTPNSPQIQKFLSKTQHSNLKKRVEIVVLTEEEKTHNQLPSMSEDINGWIESLPFKISMNLVRIKGANVKNLNKNDMNRMCRRITGCSLGLVLGGGGARGIAHLGVIKALLEAGIMVDAVGGTSQGAFIGALYAKNPDDYEKFLDDARVMANGMASMKEKVLDLTLPLVSYFDGRRFNKIIRELIGEHTKIEGLLMKYFCVSTDLCSYSRAVHKTGCCWKYVRASMSLHGYLPPISEDGRLLLDGGYTSIVPNDVMTNEIETRAVIAVDVSREEMPNYYEYGSNLSGFWLLWNSWNPFVKTVRIPSMGELSQRLIWVSSSKQQQTIGDKCDLFLTPPVDQYGVLDYHLFDEILQKGYDYAKEEIDIFLRADEYQWVIPN